MGFMDFQRPEAVQPVNFFQSYMDGKNQAQQQEMNALKMQQARNDLELQKRNMAQDDEYNSLAKQYVNAPDKAQEAYNPDGTIEKQEGKDDIFKKMLVLKSDKAKQIFDVQKGMSDEQYVQHQREAEMVGKLGFAVAQNPALLDQMFPTLPKNVQSQIASMGYDPANPSPEISKKIGEHFAMMGQDLKTLADHAFRKEERVAGQEFTADENQKNRESHEKISAGNNATSLQVANINADKASDLEDKKAGNRIKEIDYLYGKGQTKTGRNIQNHSDKAIKDQVDSMRYKDRYKNMSEVELRQEAIDILDSKGSNGNSGTMPKGNRPPIGNFQK